jgi:hypothetical protein
MTPGAASQSSPQLVLQRVRNRVIEYLEFASSFEAQREYQAVAPVHVPHEVINQWQDWVQPGWEATFTEPVFSQPERDALVAFSQAWAQVVSTTPNPLTDLESLSQTPEWESLRSAAADALAVFAVRGTLSEQQEIV